ncbi:MAG: Ig-like domain-containing protein [Nocardioidaceae bacterium]
MTAGAAAVVAFPSGTPLAAGLDLGSDGGRLGDGITNASTPTFTGTAPAGSLVSVVATSTAGGAASVIGRTIAGPDGTFRLTANPLADGAYTLISTGRAACAE